MTAAELLSSFIADLKNTEFPSSQIDLVTENASLARENTVFVCIRGARADGHEFAKAAYERGCRVFVAEHTLQLPSDAFVYTVPNSRLALSALACRFYGDPSHQMHLIGITGTKGKTTTAQLLTHILNHAGIPCGYIGTNGICYGTVRQESKNTTPDALTLQKTLSEMRNAGIHTVVIEVSSQAIMQHRVADARFTTCLFTNLSPDHIGPNEHPDFEHYMQCKRQLFLKSDVSSVVYYEDDPYASYMLTGSPATHVISCSKQNPTSAYNVQNIRPTRNTHAMGVSFSLCHKGQQTDCTLPLCGAINAVNALLAASTANSVFGIPLEKIAHFLSIATVDGRSQLIPLPNGSCVVIDYAHNGVSLRHLLNTLREYRPNRLICLFGSVGERTQLRRSELGDAAASLCDLCVLTSDNPGHESPEHIIADIAKSFVSSNAPYVAIPDREEAIRYAIGECRSGDILVLAGKGHETYQLIGDKKIPFSEYDIVMKEASRLLI